jgi:hypothetical protein
MRNIESGKRDVVVARVIAVAVVIAAVVMTVVLVAAKMTFDSLIGSRYYIYTA